MTKSKKSLVVSAFKGQFISFERQKESSPSYVLNAYIAYLFDKWNAGLITLKEYQSLIRVDIMNA